MHDSPLIESHWIAAPPDAGGAADGDYTHLTPLPGALAEDGAHGAWLASQLQRCLRESGAGFLIPTDLLDSYVSRLARVKRVSVDKAWALTCGAPVLCPAGGDLPGC